MKSYNVILNSVNSIQNGVGYNNCIYNFDWSVLENRAYYVHFTYIGEVNNLDGLSIALVSSDFIGNQNTFQATATSTSSQTSNILGFIKPYILGASSFLLAEDNTNPPIYINSRPQNNIFNVRIINNDGNLFSPVVSELAPYILNLRFVPV